MTRFMIDFEGRQPNRAYLRTVFTQNCVQLPSYLSKLALAKSGRSFTEHQFYFLRPEKTWAGEIYTMELFATEPIYKTSFITTR